MATEALDFLLKLDANVDGALKMTRAATSAEASLLKLDKVSGGAEKGLRGVGKEAERAESTLKRLRGAAVEPLQSKLKEFGEFAFITKGVESLIELPEKLIDKTKELGEEILGAAAKMETARVAFRALFGETGGDRLLEFSDELAAKTGVIDDDWKSIERTLGNAGVKLGPQMDRATALVSDLTALGGGSKEAALSAADLIARMKEMGEISPRQLVGFGLNQKEFWEELSKQTGIGIKTLRKQVDAGKVDVDYLEATVEKLVTRKTGQGLGGLGADLGNTFPARMARLKNVPEQIFESFEKSPGFATISNFIDRLTKDLTPESPLGQRLIADLNKVGEFIARIDVEKVIGTLERLASILEKVLKGIGIVGGDAVTGGIKVASDATSGGGRGALATAAVIGAGITAPVTAPFLATVYGLRKAEQKLFGDGKASGVQTALGLASGMTGGAGAVVAAGKLIGSAAEQATKSKLGIHSPSTVFADIGEDTVAGYREGVRRAAAEAQTAVGAALAPGAGGGGAAAGGVSISMPVTVSIGAAAGSGNAEALAQQVAAHLEDLLPSKLAAALEQVVMEAGG